MKLTLLSFLILLINLPLAHGQVEFIQKCESREILDKTNKQSINALIGFYKTKDCRKIANKLSTVKSFNEFIPPSYGTKQQQNLLFPWTEDFPYLYGLKSGYSYQHEEIKEGQVYDGTDLLQMKAPDYFSEQDMFHSLDLFSEFTNISVISLLPTYNYFKNPNFNVCKFIANFPKLKIITIESKLLLNPEIDKCLSDSNIDGVILRDVFSGFEGQLPATKIIGIEFFKGDLNHLLNYGDLRYLGISNETQVLDGVEALASLYEITHFSMNIKAIKDVAKIGTLINLTYLNLTCIDDEKSDNPVSQRCKIGHYLNEISFVKNLPWLEHLNLSFSNIDNLGDLTTLTKLRHLKLRGNNLTDISNIGALPKLEYLDLSGNKIEDFNNINAPQLKFLNLSGNKIGNFSALKSLTKLEFLNLSNNTLHGTLASSNLPSTLRGLNLNGGGGSAYLNNVGLEAFKSMTRNSSRDQNLQVEVLFHDFGPTTKESKMNSCAVYPVISQIPDLAHLKNLEFLSLKNNKLAVMPDIKELSNLKYLNFARNNLHVFSESLLPKNLVMLDFSVNELKAFPEISTLLQLSKIELRSNDIVNLDMLRTIPSSLRTLGLEYNLIRDLTPLQSARRVPRIGGINVDGNPIRVDPLLGDSLLIPKVESSPEKHFAEKCPDITGGQY